MPAIEINTKIPIGKYLTKPSLASVVLISNIITTNKNNTITAPTYTSIKMIDKNSAFNNNQSTAEKKKEDTRYIADFTGLLISITANELNTNNDENIKNTINSIFI